VSKLAVAPDDAAAAGRFQALAAARWGLTPRQAAILYHTCRGLTDAADIGATLGLATQGVKNHRTGIMRCLGVQTRTAAVMAAWPTYRAAQGG